MKKISENISYKEATYSLTAKQLGISNKPKKEHLENMELLAEKVFQPLREWVGGPIKINSFYRSEELNKLYWYDKKVYQLLEGNESVAKLSRKTNIPYHSLYNTYRKVLERLKKVI